MIAKNSRLDRRNRGGVAAVEAAIVLPLFVLLFLGSIDAGQFTNCYQKVSEASREGSRAATRFGTSHVNDVEAAVLNFLEDAFPGIPEQTLAGATTVTVRDGDGVVISGSGLGFVDEGSKLQVEVSLDYDSVRWFSGLSFLGGSNIQAATTMRRE